MAANYAYVALAVFVAVYLRFAWQARNKPGWTGRRDEGMRLYGLPGGNLSCALIAGVLWPLMIVALFTPRDRG